MRNIRQHFPRVLAPLRTAMMLGTARRAILAGIQVQDHTDRFAFPDDPRHFSLSRHEAGALGAGAHVCQNSLTFRTLPSKNLSERLQTATSVCILPFVISPLSSLWKGMPSSGRLMQLSRWEKKVVTPQGRFAKEGGDSGRCQALPVSTSLCLRPAASSQEESVPERGGDSPIRGGPGCSTSVNCVPQTTRWGGKLVRVKIAAPSILPLSAGFPLPAFCFLKLRGASGHCFQAFLSSLESHLQSSIWSSK